MNTKAVILSCASAVVAVLGGTYLFDQSLAKHEGNFNGTPSKPGNEIVGSASTSSPTPLAATPSSTPLPATLVSERTAGISDPGVLNGRVRQSFDTITTTQATEEQAPMGYETAYGYPSTGVEKVVVRKRYHAMVRTHYHTGRVHAVRAVKHIVGFSAKLPFKLSP